MDAGKIKSLIPQVDLRAPDERGGKSAARRSDGGIVVSKPFPALLLQDASGPADPLAPAASPARGTLAVAAPPSGIVVNLTAPLITAQTQLQLARALLAPVDYSHLKHGAAAVPAELARNGPDPLDSASDEPARAAAVGAFNTGSTPARDERSGTLAPALPNAESPETRAEAVAHGVLGALNHPAAHVNDVRNGVSPLAQARDAERLAGLALPARGVPLTSSVRLGRLVVGAVVLGVLVLLMML